MTPLDAWLAQTSAGLGLDGSTGWDHRDRVLELAREVAHGVARPAAPLTTFLLGMAAGAAGGGAADVERLAAQITAAVVAWAGDGDAG